MGTAEYGYVICTDCGGDFHESDVEDGKCWLCRGVDVRKRPRR